MRNFPSYHQLDTMDCGPTCLRIIAAHHGRNWSLQTLRDRCHISREGVSLLGISDAAESIGFRTIGVKISFAQLCEEAMLPCIVHWNLVGDIMQRIGDHSRIQSFLTGSLLSIVMAMVTFLVYSVVMGGYDMKILGIFMLGSALYVCWILLFMKRRRKLDYTRFQESSANQSSIVQLIGGMQDIKLNGCEKQKRWEWERIQARLSM